MSFTRSLSRENAYMHLNGSCGPYTVWAGLHRRPEYGRKVAANVVKPNSRVSSFRCGVCGRITAGDMRPRNGPLNWVALWTRFRVVAVSFGMLAALLFLFSCVVWTFLHTSTFCIVQVCISVCNRTIVQSISTFCAPPHPPSPFSFAVSLLLFCVVRRRFATQLRKGTWTEMEGGWDGLEDFHRQSHV